MRFANEVVLVTGGGSGIGQAIASQFAAEGASVAVTDRFSDRAESVAAQIQEAGGKAVAFTMDVTEESQVTSTFAEVSEALGPIAILVNNAGLSIGTDITTMPPEEWDINLAVVLRGPYLCCRAALPPMIEQGHGVILNIASVNGMYGIGEEGYSAAKAGLLNLTQNIAVRHGPQGIRCNAVSPGTIRTPLWDHRLETNPTSLDELASWYPLRRVGSVDDVARATLFLCSNDASWISGVNLPVDGGLTAGSARFGDALTS